MVTRLGPGAEFDLIRRFLQRAPAAAEGVRVGPGDDCAVVAGDGIAVSADMAVEDVHFRRAWLPPADLGYHAAAGALSDLAAVAARPIGLLASLALGPGDEDHVGPGVMEGIAAAAADAGAALLGGDVTRSPGPLVLDIVVLGEAARPVLRSGASAGEEVWVTGDLGAAATAVAAWMDGREPSDAARDAYARPRPRTREALWLAARGVPTAMVDLSDGIAGDAGHIAAASGVRLVIRLPALPVSRAATESPGRAMGASSGRSSAGAAGGSRSVPDDVRRAAGGGEDYELCFTASPGSVAAVAAAFEAELGTRLTRVGEVVAAGESPGELPGVVLLDADGEAVDIGGFQHWGRG